MFAPRLYPPRGGDVKFAVKFWRGESTAMRSNRDLGSTRLSAERVCAVVIRLFVNAPLNATRKGASWMHSAARSAHVWIVWRTKSSELPAKRKHYAGSLVFHKRMIDRSAIDNREGRNATRTIVQHTWYTCIFIACKKVKIYIKRSVRINYSIDFRIGSEKSIFYARLKCSDSFSVNSPEFRKGRQSQRTFAYNSDISNLGDVTLTQVIKARMWLMICKLRDYANKRT